MLLASAQDACEGMRGAVVEVQLHADHAERAGAKVMLHPRRLHGHVDCWSGSLRASSLLMGSHDLTDAELWV